MIYRLTAIWYTSLCSVWYIFAPLKYDIIPVPHMPKAYIIARSAISYRRYITRSDKERISLKKALLSKCFFHGRGRRTWSCPLAVPEIRFRLGAAADFDRFAIPAFASSATGGARRQCPARSACLGGSCLLIWSKKQTPQGVCFLLGRGRRTWTLGTRFWRPLLYQLSYTPIWLFYLVDHQGLEPRTNRLWAGCSNQLS